MNKFEAPDHQMPEQQKNQPAEKQTVEKPFPAEQAPLGDHPFDKAIEKMAAQLKYTKEGRPFELTADVKDYILRIEGIEGVTRIPKEHGEDAKGIIFSIIMSPQREEEGI